MEKRLTDIEICLAEQGRILDDLNTEVLRLSKLVRELEIKFDHLKAAQEETLVKPLAEETPPPHY